VAIYFIESFEMLDMARGLHAIKMSYLLLGLNGLYGNVMEAIHESIEILETARFCLHAGLE
jgi:hypothetical protein